MTIDWAARTHPEETIQVVAGYGKGSFFGVPLRLSYSEELLRKAAFSGLDMTDGHPEMRERFVATSFEVMRKGGFTPEAHALHVIDLTEQNGMLAVTTIRDLEEQAKRPSGNVIALEAITIKGVGSNEENWHHVKHFAAVCEADGQPVEGTRLTVNITGAEAQRLLRGPQAPSPALRACQAG